MNAVVKEFLKKHVWALATMGDCPNVVPVGTTCITDDEKLLLGDVLMETTVANVKATGKAAVCAWDNETGEGYQIKGSAVYETSGANYERLRDAVLQQSQGSMYLKGIVVVTPEETIVVTPGPENKVRL